MAGETTVSMRTSSSPPKFGINVATQVPGGVPQHGAGEQHTAVPAGDHGGQQRGAEAHHDRAGRDQLAGRCGADLQRGAEFVERAGHDHHARADDEVAGQQGPQGGRQRRPAQRRTCSAPGLTMLVGLPLMKLTTLSKAWPKYIS